jgi:predicted transcriptional regulator
MEVLYRMGKASSAQIRDSLPNPPTYAAVRTLLSILLEKGHIRYERIGLRNYYEPIVPPDEMARDVIAGVVQNFFGGSVERVVAALIEPADGSLSDGQLARLSEMIEEARKQGR